LDTDLPKSPHGVLGRFGFELASRGNVRHQGDMDIHCVAAAVLQSHLPDRLQERQGLNVTDRPADLSHDHLRFQRRLLKFPDTVFYLLRDMWNNLHRRTQVITAALSGDDGVIDLAGGDIVVFGQRLIQKPFVVPQVKVGFGTVIKYEHLAVLEGVHCSRVDVQVGIEFDVADLQAALLQQQADRGRGNSLAQR